AFRNSSSVGARPCAAVNRLIVLGIDRIPYFRYVNLVLRRLLFQESSMCFLRFFRLSGLLLSKNTSQGGSGRSLGGGAGQRQTLPVALSTLGLALQSAMS